jgi:hypothetical protein
MAQGSRNKRRGSKKKSRLRTWKRRGVKLTEKDLEHFYASMRCEMCDTEFQQDKDRSLDHDHDTGLYRGALCQRCNTGLARLGDQVKLAIQRLNQYGRKIRE